MKKVEEEDKEEKKEEKDNVIHIISWNISHHLFFLLDLNCDHVVSPRKCWGYLSHSPVRCCIIHRIYTHIFSSPSHLTSIHWSRQKPNRLVKEEVLSTWTRWESHTGPQEWQAVTIPLDKRKSPWSKCRFDFYSADQPLIQPSSILKSRLWFAAAATKGKAWLLYRDFFTQNYWSGIPK